MVGDMGRAHFLIEVLTRPIKFFIADLNSLELSESESKITQAF